MTFISYAQNYEDVMLWRALKHIEKGFYIDVGANDPTIDSVTKAFYEQGWHGINIEPLEVHHRDLVEERPRDINLRCAAGSTSGEIDLFECDVRGWATAVNTVIEKHTSEGHPGVFHRVPVLTLADICRKHVKDDIHFLKIDVEGFEDRVLQGMDFTEFRPWIVVVEATRPNSTEEVHEQWEDYLLTAHYRFVYGDGLNRFYVANEVRNLGLKLKYPPNVFDEFKIAAHYQAEVKGQQAEDRVQRAEAWALEAEDRAQQAEAQVQQAEARVQQAEARVQQAEARVQQAEARELSAEKQAQAILESLSWRITAPLRTVASLVMDLGTSKPAANTTGNRALRNIIEFTKLIPGTMWIAQYCERRCPGPWAKLMQAVAPVHPMEPLQPQHKRQVAVQNDLPPRARRIYELLKEAVENNRRAR